jgi:hypothetical protein
VHDGKVFDAELADGRTDALLSPVNNCDDSFPTGGNARAASIKGSLEAARSSYDVIILDLPSILETTYLNCEAPPLFDYWVMVVAWRDTTRQEVAQSLTNIDCVSAKLLGIVINKTGRQLFPITRARRSPFDHEVTIGTSNHAGVALPFKQNGTPNTRNL